jgi:hypothetical protein
MIAWQNAFTAKVFIQVRAIQCCSPLFSISVMLQAIKNPDISKRKRNELVMLVFESV